MITSTRLFAAFVLPLLYYYKDSKVISVCAIFLFFSDFIDGKLARKLNVQTFFGSILDSCCDKLLCISALAMIGYTYKIMWLPLILELAIFMVNVYAYRGNKNVQSSKVGKLKTLVLDFSIVVSLALITLSHMDLKYSITKEFESTIISVVAGIIIGSEIIALSDYSKKAFKGPIKSFTYAKLIPLKDLFKILFDTNFYIKHKDSPLRELIYRKK